MPIVKKKRSLKKKISDKSIIKIHSNCKSIIPFGLLYPSVGIRLTKISRNMTILPSISIEQIVGHLLVLRGRRYCLYTYFR